MHLTDVCESKLDECWRENHAQRLPRRDEHQMTSGGIEIDSRLDEEDEQRRF